MTIEDYGAGITDALLHDVAMAMAPRGVPSRGVEYTIWRREAVKALVAIRKAGYDIVPAASVQYYRWDDADKRLVRRRGRGQYDGRRRPGRDADGAGKDDRHLDGDV